MAVAEPWPTVVMAVGRGRRRTVADRGRGRGSWPSPHRGRPWVSSQLLQTGSALNALGIKRGSRPKNGFPRWRKPFRAGLQLFRA